MTYNRIHPDSERIYLFLSHGTKADILGGGTFKSTRSYWRKIAELKENNAEIEECVGVLKINYEDENGINKNILQVTPGFFGFFGIKFLSGNEELFFSNPCNVLISQKEAETRFYKKSPLGETIKFSNFRIRGGVSDENFFAVEYTPDYKIIFKDYTVNGIVESLPVHSDFQFDYIIPHRRPNDRESPSDFFIFIKLKKGVDPKALENKWSKQQKNQPQKEKNTLSHFNRIYSLQPLNEFHYSTSSTTFRKAHNMTLQQVMIFAGAGLITILCLIFNYLLLFITRLQLKIRELALRMVLGSSLRQLYVQMSVEFLMILFGAFIIGCLVMELLMPSYLAFTDIQEYSHKIWIELTGYFSAIVAISQILLLWPLFYLLRRAFSETFRGKEGGREKRMISQNILLTVQLIVGIIFIYCTSVFIKQVYYMKNMDAGFNPERLCFVDIPPRFKTFTNPRFQELKQSIEALPEIDSVAFSTRGIIEKISVISLAVFNDYRDTVACQENYVTASYFSMCEIKCLQGELFRKDNPDWNEDKIVINKSMVKLLNFENPIGQSISSGRRIHQIIGIVPDVYVSGLEAVPTVYIYSSGSEEILYRYKPGTKNVAQQKMRELLEKAGRRTFGLRFSYMDERFETDHKEDVNFMRLLYILTGVCIVGAMFGIYSMVSLACERRRKEIAIRKINGAGYNTLVRLFLKKYIILLAVACTAAFPVGYALMRSWMEQFIRRTSIGIEVYGGISAAVAVIISLIVITRIWNAIHVNPATELRKE